MRAVDTETGLIQAGLLAPPLACITWTEDVDAEPEIVHGSDPVARDVAEMILSSPYVGANIPYDLAVFCAAFPDLFPLVFESLDQDLGHDVQLAEKLFDIGDGEYRVREVDEGGEEPVYVSVRYGLTDLHERYFGSKLEKDQWRLSYGKLRHLPLSQWEPGALFYAKNDARVTLKVYHAQRAMKRRVESDRYLVNETFQVRAAFALQLISCWGIQTDRREVHRFVAQIDGEQEVRRERLQAAGLVSVTESRTKKNAIELMRATLGDSCVLTKTGIDRYRDWWRAMVKAKLEITPERKLAEKRRLLDQGYVSLAGDVCLASGSKLLVEYARYGQFQTLRTKVHRLDAHGMPIQTSFEPLLENGRTSSFASKIIPNSAATQNLPRKTGMRECFVPRNWQMSIPREQRNVFVTCDFGVAELVSLAQVCYVLFGYSKLREALNAGLDPHLDLSSMFLGISYEDAVRRKDEKLLIDMRQMSKVFNFGKPGGLGSENFVKFALAVYGVRFGETEADAIAEVTRLTRLYFKKWPEIRQYLDYIGGLTSRSPTGLCDIQQYMSNRLRGQLQFNVAANTLFSGLTADGFKQSLWEVQKRCYVGMRVDHHAYHVGELDTRFVVGHQPLYPIRREQVYLPTHLYGARVVVPVHDEIVLECREMVAHEVALELKSVMETEYAKFTPDVRITAEPALMRRWRKGAKPVYHEGRLVPFEDRALYKQEAA